NGWGHGNYCAFPSSIRMDFQSDPDPAQILLRVVTGKLRPMADPTLNGEVRHSALYPRPILRREKWTALDGAWDFAFDPDAVWSLPEEVQWSRSIIVPFSPETSASGISDTGFFRACWYRRVFPGPPLEYGQRLLLNFGAVDY